MLNANESDDGPKVNEYICHLRTKYFYLITNVEGPLIKFQAFNKRFVIDWSDPETRRQWLLVEKKLPQQLRIHQQKMKDAITKKEAKYIDKVILVGKEGKATVLKIHALIVSDSFSKMVIRAKKNELKVELGSHALAFFRDFIQGEWLNASQIDAESFSELVDIAEMYMIDEFVKILMEVMTPKMKVLNGKEIYPYMKSLGRISEEILVPFLDNWKGA